MALLMNNAGFNLQGGASSGSLGIAQAGANPLQGNPTISPAATSPSTPKSQYIQKQAQQTSKQNLSGQFASVAGANGQPNTIYNKNTGQGYSNSTDFATAAGINPNSINWGNLQFDTFWTPQSSRQPSAPAPQQTPNPPPQAPPTGMNGYSGGQGSNQGVYDPYQSPAYQQYVKTASEAYQPNPDIQKYQQAIAAINKSEKMGEVSLESGQPMSQEGLLGKEALLQKQALAEGNYAQAGLANALTRQGYQISGAQVPLTAATTEAGYLAGIVKPTAISPGQSLVLPNPGTGGSQNLGSVSSYGLGTDLSGAPVTYNQQTGQINPPNLGGTGGSSLNPLNNVSSIAQQVISGQISPSQAYAMGGSVQNWQGLLNNALQQAQPGFDQSSAQAKYDSNQSSQQAQGESVAQMTSAYQSATNLQSQLKDLLTTFNINPNDVNSLNNGLQLIKKNTSSTQYKALENLLTDLSSTYASILTPGASTDSSRAKADSLLDPSASGQSIIDTMNLLDQQAKAKIAGIKTKPTTGAASSGGTTIPADQVFGWNG